MILLVLLLSLTQPADCNDVPSCRQAALEAASRNDYEAFHDLAWRAVQKGKPNDPALMTMLARAQSLSGRPGDALVMLRRLGQMGASIDAASSDDFRRVRALAGWPEVEALLKGNPVPADAPAPAAASLVSAKAAPAPPAGGKPARSDSAATVAPSNTNAATEDEPLPAPLASIQPAGLAYDTVSRRFIVGDRGENKLVIFDDVFKRGTDMVGAESAGFFGLAAIEIDRVRGDLWVANSSVARGASLHKLQLVSGRVLFEVPVPEALGPTAFVDAAVLPDGRVLLLDGRGRRLLGLSADRTFLRNAPTNVDGATSITVTSAGMAYVAHPAGLMRVDLAARTATAVDNAPLGLRRIRAAGDALIGVQSTAEGYRIVRLRLASAGKKVQKLEVLDAAPTMPDPSAMTIVGGSVCYIASVNGSPVLRRAKLTK